MTNKPMSDEKTYDIKSFRTVKHGIEDINAYCRHCDKSFHGKSADRSARYHARKKLHTVDVYREHWIEYTSYVPYKEDSHVK